jgi:hypothetical protein
VDRLGHPAPVRARARVELRGRCGPAPPRRGQLARRMGALAPGRPPLSRGRAPRRLGPAGQARDGPGLAGLHGRRCLQAARRPGSPSARPGRRAHRRARARPAPAHGTGRLARPRLSPHPGVRADLPVRPTLGRPERPVRAGRAPPGRDPGAGPGGPPEAGDRAPATARVGRALRPWRHPDAR